MRALKMKLTSSSVMELSACEWLWALCSCSVHATEARANTGQYGHCAKASKASSSINAMCEQHPDDTSRPDM